MLPQNEDRVETMLLAAQELDRWLLDIARQGLAKLQERDTHYFENIAARLVDLKMGTIARRIRSFSSKKNQEQWRQLLSNEIADLYLFTQRFLHIHELQESEQLDLLQQAGWNAPKKDILANQEALEDRWIVLGQAFGMEERIRYRRTWIWGEKTQRAALILDFAWGNQDFEGIFSLGQGFYAKLRFYPGTKSFRALVSDIDLKDQHFARLEGQGDLEAFIFSYAKTLGEMPGLLEFPALLKEVVPFRKADQFFIADKNGYYLPLDLSLTTSWNLLATSGGFPILLFGTWNGQGFKVLSMIQDRRVIDLTK